MGHCILVTGGSGFLGSYIVRDLLRAGCADVRVLMRGSDAAECEERLRALWWARPELVEAVGTRVRAVCGDITEEQLGMDPVTYAVLARDVDIVVHAAAEVGVNQTARRFGEVNVDGTLHTLLFALDARDNGGLERFVHISTAYVAGTREGLVREDELVEAPFNSLYEHSKFGAEQLVRACMDQLPASIVRPAQIVGDSQTGFVATFNTLYYPLKLYLKGKLPVMPVSPGLKLNMVPVDYVARIAAGAALQPEAAGKTFHAVVPARLQPTAAELLEAVREWAAREIAFDPGPVRFVPAPLAGKAGRRRNLAKSAQAKRKGTLRNMLALAPYFSENREYATANTEAVFGADYPDWHSYLPKLLAYAVRVGFLNHTDRTVFEQMLVRLSSEKTSFTYHDVSREGIRSLSAQDAKQQIEQAAAALAARGIGPGARVALVGVNSTRYFMADAAVGLVGATSVPLYYTSPAGDIAELIRESNAQLVFAGTPKLVAELPRLLSVPVVSLQEAAAGTTSWEEFLAQGEGRARPSARVPLDATATIRYTSGTTGDPKGVMFNQYQLQWMGQVMPSLLDWRTRNGKLSYLSFLPMSHVVEGILVAYAPYYILSDIEFYYLNDFDALVETLPKVRPTLFFSVPRFYEKVWNEFEASAVGKRYLALPEGAAKRALGAVARRGLLRKAGLDRCRQLLVGSAPVSMDLLQAYRQLGIEIHNAYGVTEAPLIALNRLGANELGSVGELLPDTQAAIDESGQIRVSGPQVAVGYDGLGPCADGDGFFSTGDLGSRSEQGNLVIGGRGKELVITSYGKNVSPEKVETLLKGIPGVSEALLVGDARPYVAALLWLEDGALETLDAAALDAAVLACNERLSHPEQVKRWAVMDQKLSIAAGELTPNLKLRRRNVAQLNEKAIEALYGGARDGVPGALHVGEQPW